MVSHERIGKGRALPALTGGLTARRRLIGSMVALVLLPLLTLGLSLERSSLNLTSDVLLFLLAVVAVALVGGIWPASAAAVAASLLLNFYFVPPLYTFNIAERNNVLALVVFVVVAALVSRVVDVSARRTTEAVRAAAEAETLSTLADSIVRGHSALPDLLEQVRKTFAMASATLLEKLVLTRPQRSRTIRSPKRGVSTAMAGTLSPPPGRSPVNDPKRATPTFQSVTT